MTSCSACKKIPKTTAFPYILTLILRISYTRSIFFSFTWNLILQSRIYLCKVDFTFQFTLFVLTFLSTLFSDRYFIYFGSFPSISTYILSITCSSIRSEFLYVFQIKIKKMLYGSVFFFLRLSLWGTGSAFLHDHFFLPPLFPPLLKATGTSFQTGTPPVGNATFDELKKFDAFYAQDTSEKVIYLTFDAGYENGNTPAILEALTKHQAPATFFRRRHTSGKQSGTYQTDPSLPVTPSATTPGITKTCHRFLQWNPSLKKSRQLKKLYQQITGQEISILSSTTRKIQRSQPENGAGAWLSYLLLESPMSTGIQDNQPSHEEAFEKLLGRIHPGAIVLLHSTSSTNAEILDELLTKWGRNGLSFWFS